MIEIVLLSIVVLFIILISKMLIVEICIFYQRLKCKRNFFSSFFYLKRLGHVIVINGAIGAGKTTLMSLLSHLFNLNRRNEFRDKINNLKIKLNNVPFDKVDNIILDKINSGQTFDQIKKSVISI